MGGAKGEARAKSGAHKARVHWRTLGRPESQTYSFYAALLCINLMRRMKVSASAAAPLDLPATARNYATRGDVMAKHWTAERTLRAETQPTFQAKWKCGECFSKE